jgi:hypothetical protein
MYQIKIKCIYVGIVHCKTIQNLPKLEFLVRKYVYHLATLHLSKCPFVQNMYSSLYLCHVRIDSNFVARCCTAPYDLCENAFRVNRPHDFESGVPPKVSGESGARSLRFLSESDSLQLCRARPSQSALELWCLSAKMRPCKLFELWTFLLWKNTVFFIWCIRISFSRPPIFTPSSRTIFF